MDALLQDPGVVSAAGDAPRPVVAQAVRETLEGVRKALRRGKEIPADVGAHCRTVVRETLALQGMRGKQRVINATGILLHTGLGRAALSERARRAIEAAAGPCNVEFDLATGQRNLREGRAAELLCRLTGARAATVVGNNAAATWLALNTLAAGKRVVVARGQLVEIGGQFRLPEVMERAHVTLHEVGATNRVRAADYARAITKETGLLLHVHTSNYRVQGFTEETSIEELVRIGRRRKIPVMDDLGSGALMDFSAHGLVQEPHVGASLRAGADVVCFSGDKLLGGPQCGILLGSPKWIGAIRENPLFRVVRPGKLTLAALEATVEDWLREETRWETIPLLKMLAARPEALAARAEGILARLRAAAGSRADRVSSARMPSQMGSGSMPTHDLPSAGLSIGAPGREADRIAAALRRGKPALVARIQKDRVLLDLRTVDPSDDAGLAALLAAALPPVG